MNTPLTALLATAGVTPGSGATVVLNLNYTGHTEFAGRLVPEQPGKYYDFMIGFRGAHLVEVVSVKPLTEAPFYDHDQVRLLAGPHAGKLGRVELTPCACCWPEKYAHAVAERRRGRYEVRIDTTADHQGRIVVATVSALQLTDFFGEPLAFGPVTATQGELF
jgi:hypothetical protein